MHCYPSYSLSSYSPLYPAFSNVFNAMHTEFRWWQCHKLETTEMFMQKFQRTLTSDRLIFISFAIIFSWYLFSKVSSPLVPTGKRHKNHLIKLEFIIWSFMRHIAEYHPKLFIKVYNQMEWILNRGSIRLNSVQSADFEKFVQTLLLN